MEERKLPVGVQSFERLRTNDYLYVDKTEYIWNLIESGSVYFLSRPRRFGKSLLTTTIAAYFEGKKELFKGLAIEKHENEKGKDAWQKYPVIYFSLAGGQYNGSFGLAQKLNKILTSYEKKYQIDSTGIDLPNRFATLIEAMRDQTGRQVVILVDEYDKPLIDTMEVNPEQEEKNRDLYKSFFSVLKDEDEYLKFVFFTGVTKFSKVSIFSDLNQLEDISMTDDYACICGITEEELKDNFRPEIEKMASDRKLTVEGCLDRLAEMYDGYHFSSEGEGVYNPFSLMNALKQRKFGTYWYSTGTPTFLIHKLRESSFTPEQFTNGVEISEMNLTDYQADDPDPIPLFYQSGYLTICGYDPDFQIYELKFPNDEVKYGFLNSLAKTVIGVQDAENPTPARNLVRNMNSGNTDAVMKELQSLFAAIPYVEGQKKSYEQEWRNELFLIFILLGQHISCEVHSSRGRADCIVKTEKYVYVFEFKLDQSADEALKQIDEKGYALPYQSDERTVYQIGVNFSSEKRNIDNWKIVKK